MGDTSKKKTSLPEHILQYSWNCLSPKTELYAISGEKVIILFPGVWNFEEGPDFLSAKLSIDGKIVLGDIEVHRYLQDWVKHGHSKDLRYSNVILHVLGDLSKGCLDAENIIPSILTLVLPEELTKSDISKIYQKYPYGYCASMFANFSNEELLNFFNKAGLKRFYEKSSAFTKEILEIGANKTFLKYFFDSCGYKNNRREFLDLFNRFCSYDIDLLSVEELISILWGESGLLPDSVDENLSSEMKEFIGHNWEIWWKLRKCRDDIINWKLSGVRPLNTPCRRLAAIAVFISKYGFASFEFILNKLYEIEHVEEWKSLLNILICKDEIWDKYSTPSHLLNKSSAVLGRGRALDILVNVVLPLLHAYSDINNIEVLKQKAIKIWNSIPSLQLNIVLKICAQRWLIPEERAKKVFSSAASQQGAIYIHRKYCEQKQMDCIKCLFAKIKS